MKKSQDRLNEVEKNNKKISEWNKALDFPKNQKEVEEDFDRNKAIEPKDPELNLTEDPSLIKREAESKSLITKRFGSKLKSFEEFESETVENELRNDPDNMNSLYAKDVVLFNEKFLTLENYLQKKGIINTEEGKESPEFSEDKAKNEELENKKGISPIDSNRFEKDYTDNISWFEAETRKEIRKFVVLNQEGKLISFYFIA